jgi:hypothetical protein
MQALALLKFWITIRYQRGKVAPRACLVIRGWVDVAQNGSLGGLYKTWSEWASQRSWPIHRIVENHVYWLGDIETNLHSWSEVRSFQIGKRSIESFIDDVALQISYDKRLNAAVVTHNGMLDTLRLRNLSAAAVTSCQRFLDRDALMLLHVALCHVCYLPPAGHSDVNFESLIAQFFII